jgi:hypothetical protein
MHCYAATSLSVTDKQGVQQVNRIPAVLTKTKPAGTPFSSRIDGGPVLNSISANCSNGSFVLSGLTEAMWMVSDLAE